MTDSTGPTSRRRCPSGARSILSIRRRFDASTAYVAVDRHKLDDFKPYIFKTTDLGKTWTAITNGIPDGAYVHAVREDPKRRGLLYAGTEIGVFVSFDDGAHWQPLQLNLPVTPIHDLVVKDDDLVVATHGRSFWVLDDITPIRQVNAQNSAGRDDSLRTADRAAIALPGRNSISASRSATIRRPARSSITISRPRRKTRSRSIFSMRTEKLVRHLSSKEKKESEQPPEWPDRVERAKTIPANEGMNRFAWDLRYDDPVQIPGAFYSGDGPKGPLALPGRLSGAD